MSEHANVFGNGGHFKVGPDGIPFDHEPSEEVASGDHEGYATIAWVDWAEWRAFWVGEEPMGTHIDILDLSGTFKSGEAFFAEAEWRAMARGDVA